MARSVELQGLSGGERTGKMINSKYYNRVQHKLGTVQLPAKRYCAILQLQRPFGVC